MVMINKQQLNVFGMKSVAAANQSNNGNGGKQPIVMKRRVWRDGGSQ